MNEYNTQPIPKSKLVFEYTDEIGNVTKVEKTFNPVDVFETEPDGVFGYIKKQFYCFLSQAEFHNEAIQNLKN